MKKIIFLILLTITSTSIFAQTSHYAIIVDAGSSGSRLHLFEYHSNGKMPVINDVLTEKTKPGISSYVNNPVNAGASLKKILDDANTELVTRHVNPKDVTISIMATAGMRLLPKGKQQRIYHSITHYIINNYAFIPVEISTITGKMEGLYGWLDVNYLTHAFEARPYSTIGSLDMGGASTEIAYQTKDYVDKSDITTLRINAHEYTVFSKTFLGLGENQALKRIQQDAAMSACYPTKFPINKRATGAFNQASCKQVYDRWLSAFNISTQLPAKGNQSFVAFSAYYYVFDFLDAVHTPDHATIERKTQSICTQKWDQIKQSHPSVPEEYLSTYCANSIYFDDLLYSRYQLGNNQLQVVDTIKGKNVDWTLGALLYQLVK